jgi:hypothetical protein
VGKVFHGTKAIPSTTNPGARFENQIQQIPVLEQGIFVNAMKLIEITWQLKPPLELRNKHAQLISRGNSANSKTWARFG